PPQRIRGRAKSSGGTGHSSLRELSWFAAQCLRSKRRPHGAGEIWRRNLKPLMAFLRETANEPSIPHLRTNHDGFVLFTGCGGVVDNDACGSRAGDKSTAAPLCQIRETLKAEARND